jgi:hypothetical protein
LVNKKILIPLIALALVSAGFISYFSIAYASKLTIAIKDAPYDGLVYINADVAAIELRQGNAGRWYPIINAARICNCSVNGTEEEICKADLPAGTYDTIRIKFNRIRLRYNNNSLVEVQKFENQNTIANNWVEISINFVYDGIGGKMLFDITVNNDLEAVVTIVYATP